MKLSQLDLMGGETPLEHAPGPRPLTPRQEAALAYIRAAGVLGRSSDDVGAHLHHQRQQEGGRGHDQDTRCDWCGTEGKNMGAALRKRDLVWQRDRMWTAIEHRHAPVPVERPAGSIDPRTTEIPF